MKDLYEKINSLLDQQNKKDSVDLIIKKLENKEINILELYTEILTPAMTQWFCDSKNENVCIWKEHIRSSIVRTIIECCYPYVQKEKEEIYKKKNNKTVAVVCPQEEFHELGARMVADFFDLLGYNVTYVGANTPKTGFSNIINEINYDYIALSISDPYNLVQTEKIINIIKENSQSKTKILVGGYAFKNNPSLFEKLKADKLLKSFEDIENLEKEGI